MGLYWAAKFRHLSMRLNCRSKVRISVIVAWWHGKHGILSTVHYAQQITQGRSRCHLQSTAGVSFCMPSWVTGWSCACPRFAHLHSTGGAIGRNMLEYMRQLSSQPSPVMSCQALYAMAQVPGHSGTGGYLRFRHTYIYTIEHTCGEAMWKAYLGLCTRSRAWRTSLLH